MNEWMDENSTVLNPKNCTCNLNLLLFRDAPATCLSTYRPFYGRPFTKEYTYETCCQNVHIKRYSNPVTGLDRPGGFQEVAAPRFQDNRHMKVVRLSALRTGRLYPQEILLVLISGK
jgi:hypothetical protein